MATRNVTTVFAVQGESEYRKAVQNINREIKEANSELKLLAEQYRGQEDSMGALQDKLKALNDLYETQEKKIGKIEDALKNAQDASAKYVKKGDELQKQLEKNAEDLSKLAEAGDKASEAYLKLQEEEKELKKALDDNAAKFDAAERGVSDWKIKLNDAKTELLKTKSAIDDVSSALNGELTPEFAETKEETKKVGEAFRELKDKAASNMDAVATAVAAAGLDQAFDKVLDAMKACIDKSMEFESAMTGVFKTVDMTLEEEAQLAQDIRKMAEEIPVSTTEIAGVAELAGQLGISNEALLDFTETMVKLGTATNLTAEDAAEALAKIANIAGTSEENYGRLGSTVVALGNNFATTEADIVNMATRIAATGEVVGLTEAQIFAMATALSSVGIEAEAGGSAISKLLKEIETSVVTYDTAAGAIERTGYSLRDLELIQSNNSKGFKEIADELGLTSTELGRYIDTVKNLNKYAEISGQSADEFKRAWGTDAVAALDLFITGLGDLDQTGGNAVETLEEMGLTEIRLSNAVLALAESDGILTDTLNVANTAWRDNSALTDEAAKRFETTESKVQILKNSVDNLLIAIGEDYMTALTPAIEGTTNIAQSFSDWADASPALASTLAAIGGSLGLLTGLTSAVSGIKLLVGALGRMGAVGAGITIAVAALGGLATAVATYNANANAISEVTQQWIDQNERLVQSHEDSKAAFDETTGSIDENREKIDRMIERVSSLSDQTSKTAADEAILRDAVNELNGVLPNLGLTYDELTEKVNLSRQEMQRFADAAENVSRAEAYGSYISELTAQQEQLQIQHELTGEKIIEAQERLKAAQEELNGYASWQKSDVIGGDQLGKVRELEQTIASATAELDVLKDSQAKIQDALKSVNSELDLARGKYDQYADDLEKTANAEARVAEQIARRDAALASSEAEYEAELAGIRAEYDAAEDALLDDQERRREEKREILDGELEDYRDAQSDKLDSFRDMLDAETDAFKEAQEKRRDELEDKQQEELDILEAAHEEKLRLIDEEYTESLKNIDEERYNKLKEIEDEISDIEAEIEATREAEKEKNRKKRLAAAERKVAEAEDREERLAAEEALAELEAQIDAEKLEESRKNRITDLKEEKERIEEEYKAEEENAKKTRETKIAEQEALYAAEETALKTAHESQRTVLEEELKKELKAHQDAQEDRLKAYQRTLDDELKAYKKSLDEQMKALEAKFEQERLAQKAAEEKSVADTEEAARKRAEAIKSAYTQILEGTNDVLKRIGNQGAEAYAKGLAEGAGVVLESAELLAKSAKQGLESVNAFDVGENFASSFGLGIDEIGPHARTAGVNLGEKAISGTRSAIQSNSPSRKARELGQFFGEGFAIGIEDTEADVAAAVRNLSTELEIAPEIERQVRAAQRELSKLGETSKGAIDPATQYRDSMAQIDRMAAQAGAIGRNTNGPVEITVVTELDGEVIARKVSRIQHSDARITMRSSGIKK
jgi:TP901 family phage tail tape measure protein